MIIVMKPHATAAEVDAVIARLRAEGMVEHVSRGVERTLIGAMGDERPLNSEIFEQLSGVERAIRVLKPYRLVARDTHPQRQAIRVRGHALGPDSYSLVPAVSLLKDVAMADALAADIKAAGCHFLRAGLFRQVANPWRAAGPGLAGYASFAAAARAHGLVSICPVADTTQLEEALGADVDVLELSAAAQANPVLLKEAGQINKLVVLRNAGNSSLQEWVMSAEQIAAGGNHSIVFCHAGAADFDVSRIVWLQQETHLPVIAEAACQAVRADRTGSLALAALACGADGVVVPIAAQGAETSEAALALPAFLQLKEQVQGLAAVMNRTFN